MIAWDDVALDEGTGIVHIAPGCGAEDFELGARDGLPVLMPVDDVGRVLDGYGWLHGVHTHEAAELIIDHLGSDGWLFRRASCTHRYPVCWRCGTELIFRVVDEWFISAEEMREPMIEANRTVEWTPVPLRQAHGGLAAQHGRLVHLPQALLGPAAAVLPCADGHMTVVWSPRAARARLGGARRPARSCTARGSTACASACEECGETPSAWPRSATAGSTPASCRSRRSAAGATRTSPAATATARARA